jgi:hypothetical protein
LPRAAVPWLPLRRLLMRDTWPDESAEAVREE